MQGVNNERTVHVAFECVRCQLHWMEPLAACKPWPVTMLKVDCPQCFAERPLVRMVNEPLKEEDFQK